MGNLNDVLQNIGDLEQYTSITYAIADNLRDPDGNHTYVTSYNLSNSIKGVALDVMYRIDEEKQLVVDSGVLAVWFDKNKEEHMLNPLESTAEEQRVHHQFIQSLHEFYKKHGQNPLGELLSSNMQKSSIVE